MQDIPDFSSGLTAFLASSGSGAEKAIEEARKLSKDDEFVLILKPHKGIERRLVPAYINALIRKNDGMMHAGSLSLEMLLFIADTMNIGNAIERASASGRRFLVFASSRKLADRMASSPDIRVLKRYRLGLDTRKSGMIALTPGRYEK